MNRRIEPSLPIVKRSFSIKSSSAPWLALHLHGVTPAENAQRAVLLLHGATLSGYIFDPPAPAPSWQERLAARGWATYALDARGFGRSTRPVPGGPGCDENRPFAHAEDGVADVADVMRFLRAERGHAQVALVGFSWGTILAGCFLAAHPEAVSKLVLYAPIYAEPNPAWIEKLCDPRKPAAFNPAFGAYRWTTAEALRARWDADIPIADKEAWRAKEVLGAVLEGALACDPLSSNRAPPAFRAPSGPFADLFRAFTGRPIYDPSTIRAPALIVRGDADTTSTDADSQRLLRDLGSDVKRYRTIASGSHFAFFERSAPLLFEACEEFLETSSLD